VKGPSRLGRANRLGLSDLLRYDLSQLQQLVHPRILRLLHPLVENKFEIFKNILKYIGTHYLIHTWDV